MEGKPIHTSVLHLPQCNCYITTVTCDNGNIYEILYNLDIGKYEDPIIIYKHNKEGN